MVRRAEARASARHGKAGAVAIAAEPFQGCSRAVGINLGCSSSASTIYHNVVRGAYEAGINIDTCEIAPLYPGSTDNSVHHNTVCGGLQPYSIAGGQGSNNNHVHHNTAIWITAAGTGNHVHNNVAEVFNIAPGNLANNNTAANVCG